MYEDDGPEREERLERQTHRYAALAEDCDRVAHAVIEGGSSPDIMRGLSAKCLDMAGEGGMIGDEERHNLRLMAGALVRASKSFNAIRTKALPQQRRAAREETSAIRVALGIESESREPTTTELARMWDARPELHGSTRRVTPEEEAESAANMARRFAAEKAGRASPRSSRPITWPQVFDE